jgi:hypothetical protein
MALEDLSQQLSAIDPQLAASVLANPWILALIILVTVWKLTWYGIALYRSGSRRQKAWFTVLFICALILNDLGILAILYLVFNRKKSKR